MEEPWAEAAAVLSAVGRAATPAAKMRGLQAMIESIKEEYARPAVLSVAQPPTPAQPATAGATAAAGAEEGEAQGRAIPEAVTPEPSAQGIGGGPGAGLRAGETPRDQPGRRSPVLGAEELLQIVQWVLVRAPIPQVRAQLAYIEGLLFRKDAEPLDGEAGYCLATCQQALSIVAQAAVPEPDAQGAGGPPDRPTDPAAGGGMSAEDGTRLLGAL